MVEQKIDVLNGHIDADDGDGQDGLIPRTPTAEPITLALDPIRRF